MSDGCRLTRALRRQANMQLMSAEERRTLDDLAGVMFCLGLSFKLASKDGGKAQLCLEPRVDDLVRFYAKFSFMPGAHRFRLAPSGWLEQHLM